MRVSGETPRLRLLSLVQFVKNLCQLVGERRGEAKSRICAWMTKAKLLGMKELAIEGVDNGSHAHVLNSLVSSIAIDRVAD